MATHSFPTFPVANSTRQKVRSIGKFSPGPVLGGGGSDGARTECTRIEAIGKKWGLVHFLPLADFAFVRLGEIGRNWAN